MPEPRPSVFVGSSAEGLPVAEAIQRNLDDYCQIVIWSQGVFGLSEGPLETIVNELPKYDFAILILTPDDLIVSRGFKHSSPRDNVLIELGLSIGILGRNRTFIVYDRAAELKLPTDLAGVTKASYRCHESGNLQSSLGAASTSIKAAIESQGLRRVGKAELSAGVLSHIPSQAAVTPSLIPTVSREGSQPTCVLHYYDAVARQAVTIKRILEQVPIEVEFSSLNLQPVALGTQQHFGDHYRGLSLEPIEQIAVNYFEQMVLFYKKPADLEIAFEIVELLKVEGVKGPRNRHDAAGEFEIFLGPKDGSFHFGPLQM